MLTAIVPVPQHMVGRAERGVFLIEALIAILIFSLGILTLVAIQTSAVSAQSDAQYRVEAAAFADQLVSEIWLNVDRTNATNLQNTLATYAHQTGGSNCSFSGTPSATTIVTNWVAAVTAGTGKLPGATTAMQQVTVNTAAGGFNQVSVTLCWQAPKDTSMRRHTLVTFIN